MRTRHRLALVVVGAAGLVGSAAATALRRSAVEERLQQLLAGALAAPCTFESARFSFLEGLRVRGLRVLDPDDPLGPSVVEVGSVDVDYRIGLLGRGPRLTSIVLHEPTVRLAAGADGSLGISRVLRSAPRAEGGPEPPAIRVRGGRVILCGAPFLAPGTTRELRAIDADARSDDGALVVPDGRAEIEGVGVIEFAFETSADGFVRATLRAVGLDLVDALGVRPDLDVCRDLAAAGLRGRTDVTATAAFRGGVLETLAADVTLADAHVRVTLPDEPDLAPPEPLDVAIERAVVVLRDARLVVDEAHGAVLGAPFEARGSLDLGGLPGALPAERQRAEFVLDLKGARVGAEVVGVFPAHLREIQSAYDLAGTLDAHVVVSGAAALPGVDAHLDVRDATASYVGRPDGHGGRLPGFAWRVHDLAGTVDVVGTRVDIAARGRHDAATVVVEGFTDVDARERSVTDIRIAARDVPLDAALHAGFGDRAQQILGPWRPEGVAAAVDVRVVDDPDVEPTTGTDVVATFDGRATATPDLLPTPLRALRGVVRVLEPVVDGRRTSHVLLEGVSAAGDGFDVLGVDGRVDVAPVPREHLTVRLDVAEISGALHAALLASQVVPPGVQQALRTLRPAGALGVEVHVAGDDGARADEVALDLRGVSVAGWEGVPLSVAGLHGPLAYADDALRTPGLTGTVFGDAALELRGALTQLSAERPVPELTVRARGLPLDRRLRDALGVLADDAAEAWETVVGAPDLRGDVLATVRAPGAPEGELTFGITALRGGVRLLDLPLRLASGSVDYDRGTVTGAFDARLGAATLAVPEFTYATGDGRLAARATARGLAFPDDLEPLLGADAAATVRDALAPSLLHAPDLRLDWDGAARRLTLDGRLALRRAAREVASEKLSVDADLTLRDVVAAFPERGAPHVRGTLGLERTQLDPGLAITDLAGELPFDADFAAQPSRFEATLGGAHCDVAGFPLTDLSLRLSAEGPRLRVEEIDAELYGGRLTGRVGKGSERVAFRADLRLAALDLKRWGAASGSDELEGALDLAAEVRNPTGLRADLTGTGTATLSGASIRAPFVTAALQAVDRALLGAAAIEGAITSGAADFDVRGTRLLVRDFHFEGPHVPLLLDAALELRDGEAALDLADGRLDAFVYPRLRFRVLDFDPTGLLSRALGLAQFVLRRLRIQGTLRNPRTSWEILPGDVDEELRPRPLPIGDVRPFGREPW